MARCTERSQLRDNSIRTRFTYHRKKNPRFTIVAIIETVADEFFLSPATITKILKRNNVEVPSSNTIAKYTAKQHLN